MEKIIATIANELGVKDTQVENAVKLIDEGNTIPFIARYRKEVTGGLSDETLRELGERLTYLRNLEQRKQEVVKSIEEQGKLTDEILQGLAVAKTLVEVEDIYRPYKQKKKTRATVAKAKGLEPLAQIIIEQKETKPLEEIAKQNIEKLSEEDKKNKDKVVATAEEAIAGALDIIAENISDNSKYRKNIKRQCYKEALIVTRAVKPEEKPIAVGDIVALNAVLIGTSGIIQKVEGEGRVRRRLFDMGLTPGAEVFLRKKAPLGDPLEVTLRGYELTLRKDEAQFVQIKVTDVPEVKEKDGDKQEDAQ